MAKAEKDLTDLLKTIDELEEEIIKLKNEKAGMLERLNSKRHRLVDFGVDSFYRLIRSGREIKRTDDAEGQVVKKANGGRKCEATAGKVDIVNMNFFDWDGEVVYKGGAERYVYDLACLLKELGYSPRILQCSNVKFEKEFNGVKVVGIGMGNKMNMRENSSIYNYYCRDAEFVIASPLELASCITDVPVIGINHGINFDGDWVKYDKNYPHTYNDYMDALRNVEKCVCVDTNFINWTRTQDYKLALKEEYIPNYYNEKQFTKVCEKNLKRVNDEEVVFVYPRRIYAARGYDITIDAFRKVFEKYAKDKKRKVVLNFVGQVDNEEAGRKLGDLMAEYPENVFHYEYSMEEMGKAYEGADVVLVPTKYSEGTSLSCIEGMASGAAVVITNVGGLPNLVIDGFNGRIVSPSVEGIFDAAVELIEKPKVRRQIAKNGVEVAKMAFGKKKWDESWKKVIEMVK